MCTISMEGNRKGQSFEIHYNFFSIFSLYFQARDYMWNIKSFNYLDYPYIYKQGGSSEPKGDASISVEKLVVKMHII